MTFVVGAIILWIVPIFVANSIGNSKRRAGAFYGIFLGWLGVLIVAVLSPLPEKTLAEQMAAVERQRGTFKASVLEKKRTEIQARMDAENATARRYRECPFCKESMRADATVCPHCRHESPVAVAEAAAVPVNLMPTYRVHAAVHEAAHAVVALSLGIDVAFVEMNGPPEEKFFTNLGRAAEDVMRERPDEMGVMLIAGSSAENTILNARSPGGYAIDLEIIRRVRFTRRPTLEEAQTVIEPYVTQARALIAAHRDAIETVATELLTVDRLTGDQIATLVELSKSAPKRLPGWALA